MKAVLALLLLSLSGGCLGKIEDPQLGHDVTRPTIDDTDRFLCTPGTAPSVSPLRRLSVTEYRNTVRAVVAAAVGDGTADAVVAALASDLDHVPADSSEDYRKLDQVVTQAHVDRFYDVAASVGAELTRDTARLEALMGTCATDGDTGNDAGCLDAFVRDFGELALRRPLSTEELAFYRDVAYIDGDVVVPVGVAELVSVFFSAPEFLYHTELGSEPVGGADDLFRLSGHELASRLSYHFWQAPPDDELRALAADGSLLDPAIYQAQVERMFDDPRTRASIDQFFGEWLRLDELAPLEGLDANPQYSAFADGVVANGELREHMIEDTLDLTRHYVFTTDGSFSDLMTSDVSFARTEDLAGIYGVPVWNGDASSLVRFTEPRPGLLTRAAMLTTGSVQSHPILRGVFVRRRVLCDTLPNPPADLGDLPELDPAMSARARAEALTESEGSSCLACHGVINPLGFALENYDALGRYRSEEIVYDTDGAELARHPIDATSVPRVTTADARASTGASDLVDYVVESGKAEKCFVRHYFRFTFGRNEDLNADGCTLEALRTRIAEGGSLRSMLRDVALEPTFQTRRRGAL
jgi:hypothetical protein